MLFSAWDPRTPRFFSSERDPAKTRTLRASRLWAEAESCSTNICMMWIWTEIKNIYIANIVKCRPPKNRDPQPLEQESCEMWLREQVRLMRPKIIVCLGRIAAQKIISPDFKVTKQHGEFFERKGTLLMGTFHPAALLRNPNNKPAALSDFLALRDKINEICERTY